MSPENIARILDLARSEVKRWGGTEPSFTHVAFVLSQMSPEEFLTGFGVSGSDHLHRLLTAKVFPGTETEVRAVLAGTDNHLSAIRAVRRELPGEVSEPNFDDWADTTLSRKAWLTEIVEEKLDTFAHTPTDALLDEIYVIVGALRIVGFQNAYEGAHARLREIQSRAPERRPPTPSFERPPAPEEEAAGTAQIDPHQLATQLARRVRGQSHAIERVAERLALTRARLDLRPERPNGVFLFAGPTGVGKTELARQIAIAEFGGPEHLIRLDMSEYSNLEFGIARLVGSAPGFVGYSEPESWLTTRVEKNPNSVILLDEIEKAHPGVWNTFLQVFDAGRLTDGRGKSADFSNTIIIMTSNLGAREAISGPVGFGDRLDSASIRQLAVIEESIPPELLNRIDEVILFEALTLDAIAEIAEEELAETIRRLTSDGWSVTYDSTVTRWLAETGYDPAYGARHLHRNIEREFLSLMVDVPSRAVSVIVKDNQLAVSLI